MPRTFSKPRTSISTDRSDIMTLKTFSRAGLLALAGALALAIVLSVPTQIGRASCRERVLTDV